MVNDRNINTVLNVIGVDANETFKIVTSNTHIVMTKRAYISETLHLIDLDDGKMKDNYLLNLIRGVWLADKAS